MVKIMTMDAAERIGKPNKYILTPANCEGKINGLFIADELAFRTDKSTLDGRLCPLIQGVDNESKPPDPRSNC